MSTSPPGQFAEYDDILDEARQHSDLVEQVKTLKAQNDKLLSLVRYMRNELHQEGLITDKEYTRLLTETQHRVYLETNDDLKARLALADNLVEAIEAVQDWSGTRVGEAIEAYLASVK